MDTIETRLTSIEKRIDIIEGDKEHTIDILVATINDLCAECLK